jgi:hypothetical protein
MSSNNNNTSSFLCDFGINSAEVLSNAGIKSAQVLSNAIATASESNWTQNHNVPEQVISDSIVLSTTIGAIFVFSASVFGINWKWITQQKAEVSAFEVFNGTMMVLSAGIIFYTSNAAFKKLFG